MALFRADQEAPVRRRVALKVLKESLPHQEELRTMAKRNRW